MRIIRLEDAKDLPPFREFSPEELAEAYALIKASFTAADLQKYTELDEGVPMDEFLSELEETQRQCDQRNS